ncbi:outer membrane protein assembly factor BamE [Nevskia sp.]|uniref:outer membrane protein assembly factor BamE n=1 Tax=Nevskia sp. TaxID=1929292 RepID=UPI0025ED9280|nr:outer membrane protein assembly factor BamE [Nevskia sp.]
MRLILMSLLVLGLSGCSIVYKLPTRQGNVIDQKQFDLLKVGQTREQVKFLLGTPIATSPFRTDRWDYFGYYKDPRGKVSSRTISLYFDADKLARMEGVQIAGAARPLDSPDVERIQAEQQKKEAIEVQTPPAAEPAAP